MNEQNLIPFNQRAESEQRAIRSAGGVARGKKALAKKAGRELVQAMLACKEADPKVVDEVARSFGLKPEDVKKEVAMHGRQIDKAIRKGDTQAYKEVNRMAGYLDNETTTNGTFQVVIPKETADALNKWTQ